MVDLGTFGGQISSAVAINSSSQIAAYSFDGHWMAIRWSKACSRTSRISASRDTRTEVAVESPAVVFEHVSLSFDQHSVLDDISFSVAKGSMMMLLGASGAGKSVVLK